MTAPSANGAAGGLVLTGVTMELAGTRAPATVVAGVTLTVGPDGLTVARPAGDATSVDWASISWARCGEPGILSDGAPAVAVAAVVSGRLVRWLVPEDQMPPARAMAIDHLLTTRTGETGDDGGPGELPLPGPPAVDRRAPAPPPHPAPAPLPLVPAGRHDIAGPSRRRRPLAVVAAWLAIMALAVVGVALLVAASISVPHHPRPAGTASRTPQGEARTLAREISLRLADLPSGWTPVSTRSGPLSGFVTSGAAVAASPPGSTQAAARYRRCLGVGTASVPLVAAGPAPLAEATSGAFAGPATGAEMQVASITDVYATSAPVRRALGQLERHGFAGCFGAAVGDEFARSLADQAPSGVTAGTASTQALPLPRWAGIRATGLDLTLPLDVRGEATSVQLGFVFVTGSRVVSTLVSFSTTGLPQDLSRTLAATLEEAVAAAGEA